MGDSPYGNYHCPYLLDEQINITGIVLTIIIFVAEILFFPQRDVHLINESDDIPVAKDIQQKRADLLP
jgi:hypothetical protein